MAAAAVTRERPNRPRILQKGLLLLALVISGCIPPCLGTAQPLQPAPRYMSERLLASTSGKQSMSTAASRRAATPPGASCPTCFSVQSVTVPLGYQLRLNLQPDVLADLWLMPTKQAFEACNFDNAEPFSNGTIDPSQPYIFPAFATVGMYYFASSRPTLTHQQCFNGLKLAVNVIAAYPPPGSPDTPNDSQSQGLSTAAIVGITLACLLGSIVILALMACCFVRRPPADGEEEKEGFYLTAQPGCWSVWSGCWWPGGHGEDDFRKYSLAEIRAMTHNFDEEEVLGRGASSVVYRGQHRHGDLCAVKRHLRLSALATEPSGFNDFEREVQEIALLRHKNLIRLQGYCVDVGEQIWVYEYAAGRSLQERLHGSRLVDNSNQLLSTLTFKQRLDIAIGTAEGIQYLHTQGIIHRDIKPANILLDSKLEAKVADFGLLKEMETISNSRSSLASTLTRLAGTPGYIDPEYLLDGRITKASDVYSLGVVLLELMTGRKLLVENEADLRLAAKYRDPAELSSSRRTMGGIMGTPGRSTPMMSGSLTLYPMPLKEWVPILLEAGELQAVLDPALVIAEKLILLRHPLSPEANVERRTLESYFALALRCIQPSQQRPTLDDVIIQLSTMLQQWLTKGQFDGTPGPGMLGSRVPFVGGSSSYHGSMSHEL